MAQTMKIKGTDEEVVFLRHDGTPAEYLVVNRTMDTGEVVFLELIGFSGEIGKLMLEGKEVFKRLFVQKVYPSIEVAKNELCPECEQPIETCEH